MTIKGHKKSRGSEVQSSEVAEEDEEEEQESEEKELWFLLWKQNIYRDQLERWEGRDNEDAAVIDSQWYPWQDWYALIDWLKNGQLFISATWLVPVVWKMHAKTNQTLGITRWREKHKHIAAGWQYERE